MKIIVFPGVGDPGMLRGVTDLIPNAEVVTLPSGSYGPVPLPFGPSHEDSVLRLMRQGRAELDKGPAVLLGYSQGAEAAMNLAATAHPNIIAAGAVSDPMQPDLGNGLTGIRGARPVPASVRTRWMFDPKDVICQCPKDSPLRTLADQTARMSFRNPHDWVGDILARLAAQRWQQVRVEWWNPIGVQLQYRRARLDAEGYLLRGDHTGYGARKQANGLTYLQNLAAWIRSVA